MWKPQRDDSGFYLLTGPASTAVWVESDRIDECLEYYKARHFRDIAISPLMGYKLDNVEFLKRHPYVRGVILPSAAALDISGLESVRGLEYLQVSGSDMPLDLGQFKKLIEVHAQWYTGLQISSECTRLRVLDLSKYKPSSGDLTELACLPDLAELSIIDSPLASLGGVGRFVQLTTLELAYLPRLQSISAIRELRRGRLRILDCKSCKRMEDHAAVRVVKSLRAVRFNSCGEIQSLAFVKGMPDLEEFRFVNTDVKDGDLRPILRLKRVGFSKKEHYSHTPEQVDAAIGRHMER